MLDALLIPLVILMVSGATALIVVAFIVARIIHYYTKAMHRQNILEVEYRYKMRIAEMAHQERMAEEKQKNNPPYASLEDMINRQNQLRRQEREKSAKG